jgi:mono/diheme cytochrome c family protein
MELAPEEETHMPALASLLLISVSSLALLCAPAAAAGDAMAGKVIAEGWCAACHIVTAEQTSSLKGAPSFPEIANRAEGRYDVLEGFIADPHPPMLNFHLSREQIRDLLAYIDSLRAR